MHEAINAYVKTDLISPDLIQELLVIVDQIQATVSDPEQMMNFDMWTSLLQVVVAQHGIDGPEPILNGLMVMARSQKLEPSV